MTPLPEDLSLARYFLFDRLEEGLGQKIAIRYGDRAVTYEAVAQHFLQDSWSAGHMW